MYTKYCTPYINGKNKHFPHYLLADDCFGNKKLVRIVVCFITMKSFGNLLIKLNPVLRKELRRLEKLKKQLIGVNWSKYFSEICITNINN